MPPKSARAGAENWGKNWGKIPETRHKNGAANQQNCGKPVEKSAKLRFLIAASLSAPIVYIRGRRRNRHLKRVRRKRCCFVFLKAEQLVECYQSVSLADGIGDKLLKPFEIWLCTPTLIQGTIAQSGCIDRVQTGCVGRRKKLISQTSKNCGMHPHRVQLLHAEVSVHPVLVHFGVLRRSVVCKDTRISIGEAFASPLASRAAHLHYHPVDEVIEKLTPQVV